MKNFEKKLSTNNQFFLVAGPCAIESEISSMKIAEKVLKSELGDSEKQSAYISNLLKDIKLN